MFGEPFDPATALEEDDLAVALEKAKDSGFRNCGQLLANASYIQITKEGNRRKIQDILFDFAKAFPSDDGNDPDACQRQAPLWQALGRWSSLCKQEDAPELLAFLSDQHSILTRQTALQAVQRIFSIQPPVHPDMTGALADATDAIAVTCLQSLENRTNIKPSGSITLGINAIGALGALAHNRCRDWCVFVAATKCRWLIKRVQSKIENLQQEWLHEEGDHREALALLETCMSALETPQPCAEIPNSRSQNPRR